MMIPCAVVSMIKEFKVAAELHLFQVRDTIS